MAEEEGAARMNGKPFPQPFLERVGQRDAAGGFAYVAASLLLADQGGARLQVDVVLLTRSNSLRLAPVWAANQNIGATHG